jgi:hypothetical protein
MTEDINKTGDARQPDGNENDQFSYLEKKINVDRAAILEAIEQVGTDMEKVETYLINTRGL